MKSFHEQFKLKISLINRKGEIEINPNRVVTKPLPGQVHQNIIKTNAKRVLDSSESRYQSSLGKYKTLSPRIIIRDRRRYSIEKPSLVTDTANLEYKPYNLRDYISIKPPKNYELGGLGPTEIGTAQWLTRKNITEKRKAYGLALKYNKNETIEYHKRNKSSLSNV